MLPVADRSTDDLPALDSPVLVMAPEEFVLAGWKPEYWSPNDLLNRTDAFVSSSRLSALAISTGCTSLRKALAKAPLTARSMLRSNLSMTTTSRGA